MTHDCLSSVALALLRVLLAIKGSMTSGRTANGQLIIILRALLAIKGSMTSRRTVNGRLIILLRVLLAVKMIYQTIGVIN